MKNIKLNNSTDIDLAKLVSGKMLLQANTGGGKSWAMRRILEQSFGKIQHIILDTEGEFATLREKFDYILIGKGYDIAAEPKTAALMALRLWEEGVSAIIDLYELSPWERQLFVKNFVDAMVNAPKKLWRPVLLVIDEAHEYAPESDKSETGRSLHLLASKGRKRRIGVLFATQRISSLSKNVVAACKNKLIGQASLDTDMKRSAGELGFTTKEQLKTIRDLDPGEFYAFGPAISKEIIKVKIGEIKTSHGDDAISMGKVAPASSKVKKALAKLADLPQEAEQEANTISDLKSQIRNLQTENRTLKSKPNITNPQDIEKSVKQELQRHIIAFGTVENGYKNKIQEWKRFAEKLMRLLFDISQMGEEIKKMNMPNEDTGVKYAPEKLMVKIQPKAAPIEPVVIKKVKLEEVSMMSGGGTEVGISNVEHGEMGKGEKQILTAIAQQGADGITREHLTVLTGYKRSSRDTYLQRLRQRQFVQERDGKLWATIEGINNLGDDYKPLPTGDELREHLMQTLPAGEKKILEYLIELYPMGESRENISAATGYLRSSRDTYIQRLNARQLIVINGQIKASDKLFN